MEKYLTPEGKQPLSIIEIKSFCASKDTIKRVKNSQNEKKIFANHTFDNTSIFKKYKELIRLNSEQRNNHLKMGKVGLVLRWQRNRMGRPLSPPEIH